MYGDKWTLDHIVPSDTPTFGFIGLHDRRMGADVKAREQDGRNISPSLFFDYDPDCFDMNLW